MSKLIKASTFGLIDFGGKKKLSKKEKEAKAAKKEEKAREKAHDQGEAYIGQASQKAQAAHNNAFGGATQSMLGGTRSGFGQTGGGPTVRPTLFAPPAVKAGQANTVASPTSGGYAVGPSAQKKKRLPTNTLASLTR